MKKKGEQIAVYTRKSKFTGKGESIANQVELCREYIRFHFGEESLEQIVVYEDEGFSGGNINRPAFKRMMTTARGGKLRAVVVYRLDRISRNISDFSTMAEELAAMGIDFVSVKENFDTTTPMGRAMMYITSVFSQLERETIAERIRDNMHELAKTGRWLGGVTPTGYVSESVKSVTVDGKTKRACHLKLFPEEAQVVRMIFDLFLELDSLTAVEAELLRRGVRSRRGKTHTRFSIKGILQNPVYVMAEGEVYDYFREREASMFSEREEFDGVHGLLAYNRTDQSKPGQTVYLPEDQWILSVGKHPGIIPAKDWLRVQASLRRNKSKAYHKPKNNEALLTGLLFCKCGDRMYPKQYKRVTAEGEPVYTYICKMKERSKRFLCDSRNANGNVLDAAVVAQVKQLADDDSGFIAQLEKSKRFYSGDRGQYEEQLADLRAQKAENDRKIAALVDSLVDLEGSAARQRVAQRIEELHQMAEALELRLVELEGLTEQQNLSDREFDILRELLVAFRSSVDEMSVEQKRAAIRTVVHKVVWDGKKAHVVLFGAEGDAELPEMEGILSEQGEKETEDDMLPDNSMLHLCEDSK